jgi:hypothetical protein
MQAHHALNADAIRRLHLQVSIICELRYLMMLLTSRHACLRRAASRMMVTVMHKRSAGTLQPEPDGSVKLLHAMHTIRAAVLAHYGGGWP